MHLMHRMDAGPDLEWRLEREVALLAIDHHNFVIRLHGVGDFYSCKYVALWQRLLERHEGLRVFGYTARQDDAIADALRSLARDAGWSRFAMRFSNAPVATRATVTIESMRQKPADSVVCPEQTGKTGVLFNVRVVLAIKAAHCFPSTLGSTMSKVIKIQIIKGPSGEKGTAVLAEKDGFISFAASVGKNEHIPLAKILWVDLTGGGTKTRKFEMRLRDGRSFECSMSKQDYGEFIKKVPVKDSC